MASTTTATATAATSSSGGDKIDIPRLRRQVEEQFFLNLTESGVSRIVKHLLQDDYDEEDEYGEDDGAADKKKQQKKPQQQTPQASSNNNNNATKPSPIVTSKQVYEAALDMDLKEIGGKALDKELPKQKIGKV